MTFAKYILSFTVSLSDSMGMHGKGKLQVWNLTDNKWNTVCGEQWVVPDQSEQVCKMLGYKRANETKLQDETYNYDKSRMTQSNRSLIPLPKRINFNRNRLSVENQCKNTITSVHIKCEHFGKY